MVACRRCSEFYHPKCMGLKHVPDPWYCPTCERVRASDPSREARASAVPAHFGAGEAGLVRVRGGDGAGLRRFQTDVVEPLDKTGRIRPEDGADGAGRSLNSTNRSQAAGAEGAGPEEVSSRIQQIRNRARLASEAAQTGASDHAGGGEHLAEMPAPGAAEAREGEDGAGAMDAESTALEWAKIKEAWGCRSPEELIAAVSAAKARSAELDRAIATAKRHWELEDRRAAIEAQKLQVMEAAVAALPLGRHDTASLGAVAGGDVDGVAILVATQRPASPSLDTLAEGDEEAEDDEEGDEEVAAEEEEGGDALGDMWASTAPPKPKVNRRDTSAAGVVAGTDGEVMDHVLALRAAAPGLDSVGEGPEEEGGEWSAELTEAQAAARDLARPATPEKHANRPRGSGSRASEPGSEAAHLAPPAAPDDDEESLPPAYFVGRDEADRAQMLRSRSSRLSNVSRRQLDPHDGAAHSMSGSLRDAMSPRADGGEVPAYFLDRRDVVPAPVKAASRLGGSSRKSIELPRGSVDGGARARTSAPGSAAAPLSPDGGIGSVLGEVRPSKNSSGGSLPGAVAAPDTDATTLPPAYFVPKEDLSGANLLARRTSSRLISVSTRHDDAASPQHRSSTGAAPHHAGVGRSLSVRGGESLNSSLRSLKATASARMSSGAAMSPREHAAPLLAPSATERAQGLDQAPLVVPGEEPALVARGDVDEETLPPAYFGRVSQHSGRPSSHGSGLHVVTQGAAGIAAQYAEIRKTLEDAQPERSETDRDASSLQPAYFREREERRRLAKQQEAAERAAAERARQAEAQRERERREAERAAKEAAMEAEGLAVLQKVSTLARSKTRARPAGEKPERSAGTSRAEEEAPTVRSALDAAKEMLKQKGMGRRRGRR
ncbi:unnamed protein product [Pedinophyceae sp. YPF-701]|nr:unnamed protein product [Pedinophyceae sp. YPF-701]